MRQFLALLSFFVLPGFAAAEQIESFVADIAVNQDGSMVVEETIRYDFERAERHGIFRHIPLAHPQSAGSFYQDRVVEIDQLEITRNAAPEPYTITSSGGEFRVRIGDPNETITGQHTYTIRYVVAGALTYYQAGGIDLYWNVTGSEWSVPIQTAQAFVSAPAGALLDTQTCYVGANNATTECTSTSTDSGAVLFSAVDLAPGTGLTIAQALDPAVVATQVRTVWNLWWLGVVECI